MILYHFHPCFDLYIWKYREMFSLVNFTLQSILIQYHSKLFVIPALMKMHFKIKILKLPLVVRIEC